jgi:hypothetical protein
MLDRKGGPHLLRQQVVLSSARQGVHLERVVLDVIQYASLVAYATLFSPYEKNINNPTFTGW